MLLGRQQVFLEKCGMDKFMPGGLRTNFRGVADDEEGSGAHHVTIKVSRSTTISLKSTTTLRMQQVRFNMSTHVIRHGY